MRHAHAVELAHDGVSLVVIQRLRPQQPRHLHGIDNVEIIEAVHARAAPMVPVHVKLVR